MNNFFKISFCALLAGQCLATEPLLGAFGKKFGDSFDPSTAESQRLIDGSEIYLFTTTNGFRSFHSYYVAITPTTHKIYAIRAQSIDMRAGDLNQERDLVMHLLSEKYGPETTSGRERQITQGNRSVVTRIFGVQLEIIYTDSALAELARKESLAERAKNVDKSGL